MWMKNMTDILYTWSKSQPWSPKHRALFVSEQFFLAAAADTLLLSNCIGVCSTGRTAQFGLEKEKNMVVAHLASNVFFLSLSLFVAARSAWICFGVLNTELNMTLLVMQTILPAMSHLRHKIKHAVIWCTLWLMSFSFVWHLLLPLPWQTLEFSSFFPPYLSKLAQHPTPRSAWKLVE